MHRENLIVIDSSLNDLELNIANIVIKLKEKFEIEKIKSDTIHILIKETLELVEEIKVNGSEKKEIVIAIIKELINDLVEDEKDKELINEMLNKEIISNTIDLIILASKGKLNLNNEESRETIINYFKNIGPLLLEIIKHILKKIDGCIKSKKD